MEEAMDRRLFLAGLFGVAGATALATVAKPVEALAGVPGSGSGILDALDDPVMDELETTPESAEPEPVWHRGYRHGRRRRRRRGRRWRRICRRYWYRGRRQRRCFRRRVSFWIYF
jgi:hypothetical protein